MSDFTNQPPGPGGDKGPETAGDSKQPASNPTAEERVAKHARTIVSDDGDERDIVWLRAAIRIAKEHAAAAVKDAAAAVAELERERSGLKNMVAVARREREEARAERDFQQERAQVNVDLREKAEARVAELEDILHAAPTIAEVEAHAPGWLDRVRAALGKEDTSCATDR